MSPGYEPDKDQTTLAEERVCLLRIILYGGITYHVLPTVREEYSFINDEAWRKEHEDITIVLCLDHWDFDQSKIEPRKQYFFNGAIQLTPVATRYSMLGYGRLPRNNR